MPARMMPRFTPARLLILVTVLGVCAAGLLTQVQMRFALYRTPFAETLPWGAGGEPLSERVVICLVDGLRVDTSRTLEPLNALRRAGADWELTVTEPTFSIPLSHVISSGARQTTIGMLHNRAPIGPGFYRTFGTIHTAAREAGLRTGNVVTWRPGYPLAEFLDAPNTLPGTRDMTDDDPLVPRVLEVLAQDDAPNLLWVHFDIVDRAGHDAGADSAAYREAARRTAERIGEIAAALDLTRETIVVTADHGHLDRGGHGGAEPEVSTVPCVLAGAGIAPGAVGSGAQVDLASTVAWLLGTPVPTHNEGWPLADALELAPELRARRARDTVVQLLAAYDLRLERLGERDEKRDAPMPHGLRTDLVDELLAAGHWDAAWSTAANLAAELRLRWTGWRAEFARRWLQPRLYAATGLGLLTFCGSVLARRRAVTRGAPPARNPPVWLIAGAVVGVGVPVAAFVLGGNGYTLSGIGRHGLAPFAVPRMAEGAAGLVCGYAIARLLAPRTQPVPPLGTVLAGVAGGMAGVAVAGAAVYLVGFGLHPHPWQTSFAPLAILLIGSLQFIGVAMLAFPCAIIVAARTGDRDSPKGGA